MIKVMFNFDTEDYINPEAADGILFAAELLRKKGLKGCFNIVGRLAEALEKWGRQDVIEALRHHEICFHSHRHSHHPVITEYTDLEDFEEAKRLFVKDEGEGIEKVKRVLGVDKIESAVLPGDSGSYVAYYGYQELGLKACVNTYFDVFRNRPVYACNMLGIFYSIMIDKPFKQIEKSDISELIKAVPDDQGIYCVFHHPHTGIMASHPDTINFFKENTPPEEYKKSPLNSEETKKKFYENFEYFLDELLADPRFEFVTYSDLIREGEYKRVITRDMVTPLFYQLYEKFFPVTFPDSFSLADIALAFRDFLLGKEEHVCGEVYGFLDTPYTLEEPVTLTAEEITECAKYFEDGKFLPTKLTVNGKTIGPGDFVRGAISVVLGAKVVTLPPRTWQIDLDELPRVRDLRFNGTWLHVDEFEDKYISKRTKLQTWTFRLPKGTPRVIYPAYNTEYCENIEEYYRIRGLQRS